ncbi:MAG: hypothetical protein ACLRFO_01520 [Alphaproteobacteria bacterium]
MSKVAAGLLAVFLMLPTSASGAIQMCDDCYKCVAYNSTSGCTDCERDVNYCNNLEVMDCPDACTHFKSLYSTVLSGGHCSSGSVPTGDRDTLISQACSGASSCISCLEAKSTKYFSAICDSAELAAGSIMATDRLMAAIVLSGIEDCPVLDGEGGYIGGIEVIGSGDPLPPDQCQELLDWCNTDDNWENAESKCTGLGFKDETFDNCVVVCQNMKDDPLATVIQSDGSEGVCLACGGGEYYDEASESCNNCAAGTAQSASIGRHIRTSCTQCSAGTYSFVGASECTKCAAGATSTAGAGLCTNCPKGTYAPIAGSPECLACPDGTYSDTLGKSICTSCPSDDHGLTPHSLHTTLQGGLVDPEGQSYSRDSINSCYTDKNTSMNDTVGTYEWIDNCFYGLFE